MLMTHLVIIAETSAYSKLQIDLANYTVLEYNINQN